MTQKLPTVLEREPLVDAVFEVRFSELSQLSDILPGFLFNVLSPKPKISRLQAADIPQPLRMQDANLIFAPVLRLDWQDFFISVGDRSIVVSCKMPYPKWPRFKAAILDIISFVRSSGLPGKIERYSLKYVNLIPAPSLAEQISKIKLSLQLGEVKVNSHHFSLQIHHVEDDFIHILSVVSGAQAAGPDGNTFDGIVVDIDSICNVDVQDVATFAEMLDWNLERLRLANKMKFFQCLTDSTIEELGPSYD